MQHKNGQIIFPQDILINIQDRKLSVYQVMSEYIHVWKLVVYMSILQWSFYKDTIIIMILLYILLIHISIGTITEVDLSHYLCV